MGRNEGKKIESWLNLAGILGKYCFCVKCTKTVDKKCFLMCLLKGNFSLVTVD